ncbi:MAG: toprim domain-containing protein [Hyphomicrobiales bacterium]|nr:toprim domain-containing protein [Hyphomicrobiales bacterium]
MAKLAEAKIFNVVATFGAHLDEHQIPRLEQITKETGINRFHFWYDRDSAGLEGLSKAVELIAVQPRIEMEIFDWDQHFPSPVRGSVTIPESIGDVGDFSVEQLLWLRQKKII